MNSIQVSVIMLTLFLFVGCGDVETDGNSSNYSEINSRNSSFTLIAQGKKKNSVFPGDTFKNEFITNVDNNLSQIHFKLLEGPDGMRIDSNGKLTWYVEDTLDVNQTITYKVHATMNNGDISDTYEGSIYIMKPEIIGSAIIDSNGGVVSDSLENLVYKIPPHTVAEDTNFSIVKGIDFEGFPVFRLKSDPVVNIDTKIESILPDPELFHTFEGNSNVNVQARMRGEEYIVNKLWKKNMALFNYSGLNNRLPYKNEYEIPLNSDIRAEVSSVLYSSIEQNSNLLTEGEPVLFIHGYEAGGDLGGGEGTWKNFPKLVSQMNVGGIRYIPFEFRWKTNARFEDVADDLGAVLWMIVEKTGKKVHIVSHSFGGLLSRTLLQKYNRSGIDFHRCVASLTTLGTPHLGIFDERITRDDITLPKGQNSFLFDYCEQISCHEAGVRIDSLDYSLYDINAMPGEIPFKLAKNDENHSLDNLPVNVLIGMTVSNDKLDEGDGLIMFDAQRYSPDTSFGPALLEGNEVSGAIVYEKILGFGNEKRPGDEVDHQGYKHSDLIVSWDDVAEPYVECSNSQTCNHDGWKEVAEWLKNHPVDRFDQEQLQISLKVVDSNNIPISNASVKVGLSGVLISDTYKTNIDGTVTFPVLFNPNSNYDIYVIAPGYPSNVFKNRVHTQGTLEESGTGNVGTLMLLNNAIQLYTFEVHIIDSTTGQPVPDVDYTLMKENGSSLYRGNAENDGILSINILPGNYVLTLHKEGYIDTTQHIVIASDIVKQYDLRPSIRSGQMSIRLTWSQNPNDLDSHLMKYDANGTLLYHLYYRHMRDETTGDVLDRDDTTSYGPETITIQNLDSSASYVYAVYHYSGSGSITSTSNAKVVVNYDNVSREFNAPVSGEGKWWKVFEILDGEIVPCVNNCLLNTTPSLMETRSLVLGYDWINQAESDIRAAIK